MAYLKIASAIFAIALTAACGGTTIQSPMSFDLGGPLTAVGASGGPEVSPRDADFAGLINGIRRSDGSGLVTHNAKLNRAAQGHADDMLAKGYFSHTSKDGRTGEDRIRAQGYDPVAWGENIARGYSTNAAVMKAWQNSPPHQRLLVADSVNEFGLGVAGTGGATRWVLVMAAD